MKKKDDVANQRGKIRELTSETTRRAHYQRGEAEKRYTAHLEQLAHDLAAQYDNVAKLQLGLDRQRREEFDLRRELALRNATIEELNMEIKSKTACLIADINAIRAEKSSLEDKLASTRLTVERQQRQTKSDQNRANAECQSLRQRMDRADADLMQARRENLRLSEKIGQLEKEINMKHSANESPDKCKDNNSREGKRNHQRDDPITAREKRRTGKNESDLSNRKPVVSIGPVSTDRDLENDSQILTMPLYIQQPCLYVKKEPIKVDICVRVIPKKKKKQVNDFDAKGLAKPVSEPVTVIIAESEVSNEVSNIEKDYELGDEMKEEEQSVLTHQTEKIHNVNLNGDEDIPISKDTDFEENIVTHSDNKLFSHDDNADNSSKDLQSVVPREATENKIGINVDECSDENILAAIESEVVTKGKNGLTGCKSQKLLADEVSPKENENQKIENESHLSQELGATALKNDEETSRENTAIPKEATENESNDEKNICVDDDKDKNLAIETES